MLQSRKLVTQVVIDMNILKMTDWMLSDDFAKDFAESRQLGDGNCCQSSSAKEMVRQARYFALLCFD
jgi:hypothetical protein